MDLQDKLHAILQDGMVDKSFSDSFGVHPTATYGTKVSAQFFFKDNGTHGLGFFDLEDLDIRIFQIQQFCDIIVHTKHLLSLILRLKSMITEMLKRAIS